MGNNVRTWGAEQDIEELMADIEEICRKPPSTATVAAAQAPAAQAPAAQAPPVEEPDVDMDQAENPGGQ